MGVWSFLRKPFQRRNASFESLLRSFFGTSDSEAISVTPDSSLRCTTVFACVRVRAESIAQCPFIVYQQSGDIKQRARDYWLYPLLHDQPNEWMTAYEFWELVEVCLCLRGNFFALIIRVGGEVKELVPIHPDKVTVNISDNRVLTYTIEGNGTPYPASRILHIKGLSLDGYVGLNPIQYQRESIRLAMTTQRHGERIFTNGARPGGILTVPENTGDEEMAFLKKEWDDKFTNGNLYSTAILPAGITWSALGMNGVDAQFIETRKYSRTEICSIFRVPPHKVMDLERATFTNIEHQSLEFQQSLLPEFRRIEGCIKRDLIPAEERTDYFGEFLADSIVRADLKTRMESYSLGIASRVINPNEARAKENMNPYPGGDEYSNPNVTPGTGGKQDAATN